MTYNENIKKAIYKWRETHHEQYNNYNIIKAREWKDKNREKHNKTELLRYYYKKECKRLRFILIDELEAL